MNARPGPRVRPLAGLAVFVLALHWWALHGIPAIDAAAPPRPVAIQLRSATSAAPPPSHPAALAAERPVPPRRASTPSRAAAPPDAAVQEIAATPVPAAAATLASSTEASTAQASTTTAAAGAPDVIALPAPARWHYEVQARRRGTLLQATATLDWSHDGQQYEAQLHVQGPVPRWQSSRGRLGVHGLEPVRFSDRFRSEEAAHFDRERGQVVFSSNRPAAALQPGAQDRVGVLLQLAGWITAQPQRFASGAALRMQVAGTREADTWTFTVDGPQVLVLPGGTLQAIKLTRAPEREYDLRWEAWFVPGADYGPVRLRLTAPNGDWTDLQWSGTDKG